MGNMATGAVAPTLVVIDGIPTTTSADVAEFFGKDHRHVLASIRNLVTELPENHLPNFRQTVIERPNPSGGAPIQSPAYRLTRDGFTLLAMGFTGKQALAFKLAYIDAFNKMEASLYAAPPAPTPITSLLNRRWLGSFDDHGREQIRFIDWDDCLVKYSNLPTLIKDPGNVLRAELLAAIVQACFERLHSNTKDLTETIQLLRKALDMKNGAVAQPRKAS